MYDENHLNTTLNVLQLHTQRYQKVQRGEIVRMGLES